MNRKEKDGIHLFSSVGGNCPAERKHFPRPANKQAEPRELESTRLMILGPGVARRWEARPRSTTGLGLPDEAEHRTGMMSPVVPCASSSSFLSTAASERADTDTDSARRRQRHFDVEEPKPHASNSQHNRRSIEHEQGRGSRKLWARSTLMAVKTNRLSRRRSVWVWCGVESICVPRKFPHQPTHLGLGSIDRPVSLSLSFPEQVTRIMTCPEHSGHHFWACPISSSCAKASILVPSLLYTLIPV